MREILFRGKSIDSREWVYGSFIPDWLEVYQGADMDGFIKPFGRTKEERLMVEVERATVGQYTGLTDKNGKKVFEGDIIKGVDTGKVFSIEWHEPAFIRVDNRRYFFWDMRTESYEVIGNRWDNPELLEGKNEK